MNKVTILKVLLIITLVSMSFLILAFLLAYPGIIFLKPLPDWFNPNQRFIYFLIITSLFLLLFGTQRLYKRDSKFRIYIIISTLLPLLSFFFYNNKDRGTQISIAYSIIAATILISLSFSKDVKEYLDSNIQEVNLNS